MLKNALPIRTIFLAAFLLVGLLPIVLMSFLAFYEAKTALTTEIQHDMQARAKATADEIDRMMFERLQNVASWSRLDIMQDARIDDVDKRLSHFLLDLKTSYRGVYLNLDVINTAGIVVASSDPKHIGQLLKPQAPWISVNMPAQQIHLSKLNAKSLRIAAPIEDSEEPIVLGTLVAEFNWQVVQSILNNAVTGRSAAALIDKQQRLIALTDNWHQDSKPHSIRVRAVANAYQNATQLGWQVEFAQHKSEVMAPVKRMTHIFIGLLLASVALALMIGIPVARSITQPLSKLTQFAKQFSRTDATDKPPVDGPAEVQQLSQAFGKMIDDLAQSNENLTRAAKLAVAGEMAAAMSHEVRTPLGILRSSAQVLLREPHLSEDGKEVCGFIISETDRMNNLVSTLIDAGRPRKPDFQAHDLSIIAHQVCAMLRIQADKKEVAVTLIAPEAVITLCDEAQIKQVLLNLILNAIQILPAQGQVIVEVSKQADFAEIKVSDNGQGIDESARAQVFEPFYSQRAGGIGLGLSVVKQIVEAHQGHIMVTKSQMQGAEFCVQLPILGAQTL